MSDVLRGLETAENACLIGPSGDRVLAQLDALAGSGGPVDPGLRGRTLLRRAELQTFRKAYAAAVADVQAAGRLLQDDPHRSVQAELLAARLLNRTLRRDAARQTLAHAQRSAAAGPAPERLALAMTQAELALDAGQQDPAALSFERALGLARTDAVAHDRLQALLGLSALAMLRDDPVAASHRLRQALDLAHAHQDAQNGAEIALSLGSVLLRLKDRAGARSALEQAASRADLPGVLAPSVLSLLAHIAFDDKRLDDTVRYAIAAAKAGAAHGNAGVYADGTILAARAQHDAGQLAAARLTLDAGQNVLRDRGEDKLADIVKLAGRDWPG
ncbi:MAG: hypothetical protein GXP62_04575 [Oligoflexia bacterium]|nr:hypothetical protein [Oligoflexia bacterium]